MRAVAGRAGFATGCYIGRSWFFSQVQDLALGRMVSVALANTDWIRGCRPGEQHAGEQDEALHALTSQKKDASGQLPGTGPSPTPGRAKCECPTEVVSSHVTRPGLDPHLLRRLPGVHPSSGVVDDQDVRRSADA